jgi:hypothetical protein
VGHELDFAPDDDNEITFGVSTHSRDIVSTFDLGVVGDIPWLASIELIHGRVRKLDADPNGAEQVNRERELIGVSGC